jgi:hypothetical protein
MTQVARAAQKDGDMSRACRLYLYVVECSEMCDQTDVATDYSSQLADMLLNIYCGAPTAVTRDLRVVADTAHVLSTAIKLVCTGMSKVD